MIYFMLCLYVHAGTTRTEDAYFYFAGISSFEDHTTSKNDFYYGVLELETQK